MAVDIQISTAAGKSKLPISQRLAHMYIRQAFVPWEDLYNISSPTPKSSLATLPSKLTSGNYSLLSASFCVSGLGSNDETLPPAPSRCLFTFIFAYSIPPISPLPTKCSQATIWVTCAFPPSIDPRRPSRWSRNVFLPLWGITFSAHVVTFTSQKNAHWLHCRTLPFITHTEFLVTNHFNYPSSYTVQTKPNISLRNYPFSSVSAHSKSTRANSDLLGTSSIRFCFRFP